MTWKSLLWKQVWKPLFENHNHSLVFRRFLESLADHDIDFYVKNLDNKILDGLIDKVCNSNSSVELLQLLTPVMRIWNNYKKDKNWGILIFPLVYITFNFL